MKAANAGNGGVLRDFHTVGEKGLAKVVEIVNRKSWMSFAGRTEVGFDADVDLLAATFEPAAAAGLQSDWLGEFAQAKKRTVEFAGGGLAPGGSGDLDMVETYNPEFHSPSRIPALCRLEGSDLFLISTLSADEKFTTPVLVTAGFAGASLDVLRPNGALLYLKLRDAPDSADRLLAPVFPAL